jgi:PAS domain S-box-containing protein
MSNVFVFNTISTPILIAFLVSAVLAFMTSGKGNSRGQAFLGLTMGALAIYNLFYFLELNVLSVEAKVRMVKLRYVGGVFITPFVWLFAKKLTSNKSIPITLIIGLMIVPIINLMGALTNRIHGALLYDARLVDSPIGSHQFLDYESGLIFYVHSSYNLILALHAFWMIGRGYLTAKSTEKSQLGLTFLAFCVSLLSYFLLLSNVLFEFLDPLSVTSVLTGIILYIAIYRFGLLNNLPLAYKTLFHHLKDGVLVFNESFNLSFYNAASVEALGLSASSIGKTNSDLFRQNPEFIDWMMSSGSLEQDTTELNLSGPGNRCFQVHSSKLFSGNKVIGHLLILSDISEKKRHLRTLEEMNAQLEANDQRFRSIVDNANDIIFFLDHAGYFTYLSPNWERLLGKIPKDWLNRKFQELVHPDDLEQANAAFDALKEQKTAIRGTIFRVATHSGNFVWQEFNASPYTDENGKVTGVVGVGRDVTEYIQYRKQLEDSEKEARELAQKYQNILENNSVFFLRIDRNENLKYVNGCFVALFESLYKDTNSFLDTLSDQDKRKVSVVLENCFQNPGDPISIICQHLDFSGGWRGIKWEFKAVPEGSDGKMEVLGVGVEITEQLNTLETTNSLLQTTAKQNEKLKDFTYIISHNIRSHAANFLGLIDVLKKSEVSSTDSQIFLDHIETTALKLDETLRHLGKVVTIQEEGKRKELESCQLNAFVSRALKIFQGQLSQIQSVVTIDIADDVFVKAIPNYLESVCLNIISNSIKYRKPHSKLLLSISIAKEENRIMVYFCDNGIGLDVQQYKKKIFGLYQTFHQNEDARGLGLFITKAQVESMCGEISVTGKQDEGCCFIVSLPSSDQKR